MINQLKELQLPRLVLIKNLAFPEPYREDPEFIDGKLIDSGHTITKLRDSIPGKLPVPFDEDKWLLYEYKFGSRNLADGYFTDLPMDLADELCDRRIFGESYTIIWLVPPDLESILNVLKKLPLAGFGPEQIWEWYLDRMVVFPPKCLDAVKSQFELGFNFTVQEKFTEIMNS